MARIDLIDVSKTLTDRRGTFSIRDVTLRVPDGQTMVILGPSGCGKTTLLKLIAGLIVPDAGRVLYDGVNVCDLRPGDRRIGMVFQNYALYPHLASRTNVLSYFLFRKKTPALDSLAREKYRRTSELMGVELTALLDRKPPTLSGGEKQRVAVARCVTRDASLFLVDEPFANLDQALRERYRVNLKLLLREYAITTVYVTHDHHEALILGDVLAVMDRGDVAQVGTAEQLYHTPKNEFVAGFLNLHTGSPPISFVDATHLPERWSLGDVRIGVRPEDVDVSTTERADGVPASVASTLRLPFKDETLIALRLNDEEIYARTSGDHRFAAHQRVWVAFKRYHVFDKPSGARLSSAALASRA